MSGNVVDGGGVSQGPCVYTREQCLGIVAVVVVHLSPDCAVHGHAK